MNFVNGHILTQDKTQPVASSMEVDNGLIRNVADAKSDGYDLRGRTVLPGFNDAHIHVWKVGQLADFIIDLRGVKSIALLQEAVRKKASSTPDGQWIIGRGFNEQVLEDRRMPTKEDLDQVTTRHPIYLIRTCAHIAAVNSLALNRCGLDANVVSPDGGAVGRTEDGSLTGIFYETALGLITKHIPQPSKSDYKKMIRKGAEILISWGVTSATDPAVDPPLLEAYLEMSEEELPVRMNLMPVLLPDGGSVPFPIPQKHSTDRMKVDTVKFFADGGLSGKTAALRGSYLNSKDHGILRLKKKVFHDLAREAQSKGFRIGTHAIGDEAIALVLSVYNDLKYEFGNTRNRIEHFGLPTADQIKDMSAGGFVAIPQPVFIYELGENFRQSLTGDYLSRCYPVKSLLDAGIPVAFSTDGPVVKNINPWICIRAARDRMTSQGASIAPGESVSLDKAIGLYTAGSAYAEGTDHQKGTLAPGMYADFIVLNRNPYECATSSLDEIKVEEVYVAGKRVDQNK